MAAQFNPTSDSVWVRYINDYYVQGDHPLYMLVFFLLIVFFTYFYVSIAFQPRRGRGQHEEVRRLHPQDRAGQADQGVPRLRLPASRCRARCTSV